MPDLSLGSKGVNAALNSLISLATPQSQLKLAFRNATSPDRFLWVALQDGRWLVLDRGDGDQAYLMSKMPLATHSAMPLVVELQGGELGMVESFQASTLQKVRAPDGEYALQRSGKIQVQGGKLAGVSGTPHAPAVASAAP